MSNTDGFIEEVSEEVRKDKLFALYKKYGWIAVLVIFGLVGGAVFLEYQKSASANAAAARGDALIAALEQDDATLRALELNNISNSGGTEVPIAELHRAGVLLEQDDTLGALKIYDSLKSGTDIYAQIATLKAIMVRGSTMNIDDRIKTLETMSAAGNPFRTIALEQKAIAYIDSGDGKEALSVLMSLINEAGVSQALLSRSQQMIVALGGKIPEKINLLSNDEVAQ